MVTPLSEIRHDHSHICPGCNEELAEVNEEIKKGRKNFVCTDDSCFVEICICNGTMDRKTRTVDELILKTQELVGILNINTGDVFSESDAESIQTLRKAVNTLVDDNIEDLIVEDQKERVNSVREEFEEIAESIEKRIDSSYMSPQGEELLKIRDVFVPKESVLLYSVFFVDADEDDTAELYQIPVGDFPVYSEEEVSPFEVDWKKELKQEDLMK